MNSSFKDVSYAFRSLLKRPAFTLISVITLALGIGASTAIFSVVHAVLLRSYLSDESQSVSGAALRVNSLAIADCQLPI
jgi:hypothetical protein